MGPRSPSPLPSPRAAPEQLPSLDNDMDMTLANGGFPATPTHRVYPRTPIPRSKRQPFEPTSVLNTDTTPKAQASAERDRDPAKASSVVEPLSIKKRSSVRTESSVATLSPGRGSSSPGSARRTSLTLTRRPSPIGKSAFANAGTRRVSGQRTTKVLAGAEDVDPDEVEMKLKRAADATKTDVSICVLDFFYRAKLRCGLDLQIEDSHRAIKRIRLETQKANSSSPVRAAVATWEAKPTVSVSPVKRTPQRGPTLVCTHSVDPLLPLLNEAQTREAEARRAEMLQAIGKRNGDSGGPPRPRVQTTFEPSTSSASVMSNGGGSPRGAVPEDSMRIIDTLAEEADQQLEQALRNQESVTSEIRVLVQLLHQVRSSRWTGFLRRSLT